ncbi:MAG: LysE family transporter [Anaerolineales bacterium]|nr:LysE family transporter [Anaerolineales bacterium]
MPVASLLSVYFFAFGISLGAVISPGPVSAAIVTEAPRKGWRVGPLVATGHVFLELIFISIIGLGLTSGLTNPRLRSGIAIIGSLLLFFMGFSYFWMVIKGKARLPEADQEVQLRKGSSLILLGIITTISNPFWYAWWATVVPGYLAELQSLAFISIAVFYLGHISADYLWDTVLSSAVSSGRRWLTDRRYALLILITGGFMIYLAIVFLREGLGL